MKKLSEFLSLLLAVAMLFSTLASCSTGGGDDTDTTTVVTGTTEGRTYKNEYFDLSLTLPAHW